MAGFVSKAAIAMLVISASSAVAYAATRERPRAASGKPSGTRPAAPRITHHPKRRAIRMSARFAFASRGTVARFECRLDGAKWRPCKTLVAFAGLSPGSHSFSVLAVDRHERRGAAARFRWTILEAKGFAIVPDLANLGALYPGAPPAEIAMTVANPNPVPIYVTGLTVSVGSSPAECASADNLALGPSSASRTKPLEVPARGSIRLPARGVHSPSIQLRDLPVNQDACQNVSFPLQFSGSARG